MNPDFSQNEREPLEAKLTALLLGELSAEESAALCKAMEQDRELTALYEQLKLTIEFVREGALNPVAETATPSTPLKLSQEKREKLLAQFRTIEPKEFARPRRVMDWLTPLAAAAVILIFLGYALVPNFIKSRETARKNTVINNLCLLNDAKKHWALENNKTVDAEPTLDDLKPYLGRDGVTALPSVAGETYVPGKVSDLPKVEASARDAKRLFGSQALAGAETRDGKVLLSPLASMEAALRPEQVTTGPMVLGSNLRSVPEISYHADSEVRILNQKAPLQTVWGHAPVSTQASVVPPTPKTRIVLPPGDQPADNFQAGVEKNGDGQVTEETPRREAWSGLMAAFKQLQQGETNSLPAFMPAQNVTLGGITITNSIAGAAGRIVVDPETPHLIINADDAGVDRSELSKLESQNSQPGGGGGAGAAGDIHILAYNWYSATTNGTMTASGGTLPKSQSGAMHIYGVNRDGGVTNTIVLPSAISGTTLAVESSPSDPALNAKSANVSSNESRALGFDWYLGTGLDTNGIAANARTSPPNRTQTAAPTATDRIRSVTEGEVQTAQIVQAGKLMFQMGKLDDAEAKMNEALNSDPSNQAALYYKSLIQQAGGRQVADDRNLTSMRGMVDVDKGWADSDTRKKLDATQNIAPPNVTVAARFVEVRNDTNLQNQPTPQTQKTSVIAYQSAKEELDNAKRWRQILAMKAGQEEVDKDLPRVIPVSIAELASVAPAEKPSLGEKLKETLSGKVERTARITLEQERPDITVFGGPSVSQGYDPYFLLTEFETIQSHAVLGKVVSALKLNEEWGKKYNRGQPMNEADTEELLKRSLDLSTEKNTKLIDIGVKSEKPEDAARIANAVAEAYRSYRQEEYELLKNRGIVSLQTQLGEQDQRVKVAQANVDELAKKLNEFDAATGMPIAGADTKSPGTAHTRTFQVDPNTFYASLKTSDAVPTAVPPPVLPSHTNRGLRYVTGLDPAAEIQSAVIQFFLAKGMDLTAPNSVFFNDRQGTLTVHAATADLDRVTAIMDAFNAQADTALPKPSVAPPTPQPEILVRENAFSTFSLNVSDVSFKLAAASLEKGQIPEPASIRSEEFINAFDYRDPEASPGVPIAFASERARYPFAHNRDLLRFSIKTAASGRQAGRPLNIVLLLDNSGSMERADRVRIIQEALRVLAGQLQPADTFSIVTFARTAQLRVDGVPGNQAAAAAQEIAKLTPEGGTNLGEALDLAYETALHHYLAKGDNRVVLLTDGAANLGAVQPETLKQKVEAHRKQGVALDCFGIGWEGYNDDLLEVLTRNGDGRYGFINTPEEANTEFVSQIAGALHVAAADVKVQVEFNPKRVTSYRQIGYAKHQLTKEQFRDNTVDAAEIAAQEAGNALYTIETNPQGEGSIATVRVRYKVPTTGEIREQAWDVPYAGGAVALEQASPAMRLATTASAFSEWLATSPFAAEVSTDQLLNQLSGVPQVYGADARPKKLEWMIRQAGSISGK